jgi:hypothetical protein
VTAKDGGKTLPASRNRGVGTPQCKTQGFLTIGNTGYDSSERGVLAVDWGLRKTSNAILGTTCSWRGSCRELVGEEG